MSEFMKLTATDMKSILQKLTVITVFLETIQDEQNPDEFSIKDTISEQEPCIHLVGAVFTAHKENEDIVLDQQLLNTVRIAQKFSPEVNDLRRKAATSSDVLVGYVVRDDLLYRVGSVALSDSDRGSCVTSQIVVPENRVDVQFEVVKYFHDLHGGHPGRAALTRWIWRHFYWKRLDQRVRSFNRDCLGCQARQQAANRKRVMSSRPPACPVRFGPFAIAYFDSSGPYQFVYEENGQKRTGKFYLFSLVCQSTRYIRVLPTVDKSAAAASQALYQLLAEEGRRPSDV
ncbi:hypothetical protein Pmar_PMAR019706 [Perkinsus marinus ATCC 50983]|uniref:Integrase zinc-binding domain-containing protein n=1 Tax=Perkinsus marinus (strain ATCC 50983 / TXsc) TaxID=423536 RepID=C5LVZ1_PERM5|nr:hypothetical protein Pmar_PMAR019706 [Perkinsus marinus ATCC 50983]EEQ99061.1 hypothetical protein Pmar_PMAR019706 [Perkinsus marinus ATCC 50983]|eukprot:XP_002766344.1 hypothetical protein Pmar_PMAR019706 [Perkinsus marinus ATCC 50983]